MGVGGGLPSPWGEQRGREWGEERGSHASHTHPLNSGLGSHERLLIRSGPGEGPGKPRLPVQPIQPRPRAAGKGWDL